MALACNRKAGKSFPYWERESRVSHQLPQSLGTLHEGGSSVLAHPETGKAEMYRDRREQGGKAGATRISCAVGVTTVPSVLLCRGTCQILPLKKVGWLHQTPER